VLLLPTKANVEPFFAKTTNYRVVQTCNYEKIEFLTFLIGATSLGAQK
jgi:phosphatidylserine decarboxylase